jgi:ParB/RepB/Spo0J family partition protein
MKNRKQVEKDRKKDSIHPAGCKPHQGLNEKETKKTVIMIPLDKCVPMPELEREFYDDSNYQRLKENIDDRGLDKTSPIKVLPTDGVYEIYAGIHRWKAAKELGRFGNIPAFIDWEIDRQQALAEGIIDNHTHASYNPVDFARHIKEWGMNQAKKETEGLKPLGAGRPKTVVIERIAARFHISEKTAKNYLRMLKLPQEVLELVGHGKLWVTHAIIVTKLLGTPYASKVLELANKTVEENLSERKLEGIVDSILKKGSYDEDCRCTACGKIYPFKAMHNERLCPTCEENKGMLKKEDTIAHNLARTRFLEFNDKVERARRDGKKIPASVNGYLEELHIRWLGKELNQD